MAAVQSRYARAFADVVFERRLDVNGVLQQLRALVDVLASSEPLRRVWENPAIPAEQKRRLLDAIVARADISREVRNFAAVLIDHRRIEQLGDIARQVETELDLRLGLAEAHVTSSRALDSEEQRALELRLQEMTGRRVRAHYTTDPALLGGAVVKVGSTIYDGSVRGQLQRMKEQLAAE